MLNIYTFPEPILRRLLHVELFWTLASGRIWASGVFRLRSHKMRRRAKPWPVWFAVLRHGMAATWRGLQRPESETGWTSDVAKVVTTCVKCYVPIQGLHPWRAAFLGQLRHNKGVPNSKAPLNAAKERSLHFPNLYPAPDGSFVAQRNPKWFTAQPGNVDSALFVAAGHLP